jgi:hypothetical protein
LIVASFVEKPNQEVSEGYLQAGGYQCNAGMFVLKASFWLAAIEQFAPAILQATRTALDARKTYGAFVHPGKAEFEANPSEQWTTPSWIIAPVASRSKSSKCNRTPTWARTTSCGLKTSTTEL